MAKRRVCRTILTIVVVAGLCSIGSGCTKLEWKCDSNECIPMDELCDGVPNCRDGSDETADNCIGQECQDFAFQCAYGACVSGNAKCNGVKECADNSDEISSLCDRDVEKPESKCLQTEFQCASGECVDIDYACDGSSECRDQSDETVDTCAATSCPPFVFRCGYGACISRKLICNGHPDCRDGSDEGLKLCGKLPQPTTTQKPTTRPTTQTTQSPTTRPTTEAPSATSSGCIAPTLPNMKLTFEGNSTVIRPGEILTDLTSIEYHCKPGFEKDGLQFNLCFDSDWFSKTHASCLKSCSSQALKGVTFSAHCQLDGLPIPCVSPIRPGTKAKISCQTHYIKPDRNPPDELTCQEDGSWDFQPFRCEPICGEQLAEISGEHSRIDSRSDSREIRKDYVPWHAAIYQKKLGSFQHICGGTIVSAKIVVTAAHCFKDPITLLDIDKSNFLVGAGKYYRDYLTTESSAQFQNVSEIVIPTEFSGDLTNFKSDIAVLVLSNFLKFSTYIAPACIDWKRGAAKSIRSGTRGLVPGWGMDETGHYSEQLRTIESTTSSYSDCREAAGQQLADALTTDKFCVLKSNDLSVCEGFSGGGFLIKKRSGNKIISYLWGVVSGGVPHNAKCNEKKFVSYTNIQFHENLIVHRMISNRPK